MTKREFETLIGKTVSDNDYRIIENVYTFHPAIPNVNGKKVVADLYKKCGIGVFMAMTEAAEEERKRDVLKREAKFRIEKLKEQIAKDEKLIEELERQSSVEAGYWTLI